MAARRARSLPETDRNQRSEYDKTRQAILDAAVEVFYEKGFSVGTTREIAHKVKLTQPAIYHYVGAKDELLREMILRVDRELATTLERGLARSSDPREQLAAILEELTATIVRNRRTFVVYSRERYHLPRDILQMIDRNEREFVDRMSMIVRQLQEAGTLPADRSASVMALGITGMVAWVHLWYRAADSPEPKEISDTFCSMLGL